MKKKFHKQLLYNNYIFSVKYIPCFSDPEINPLFARRAAKAAGKGIFVFSQFKPPKIC